MLKVLELLVGVGAQTARVPRRFALIMVAREWLASPGLGSFGVMLGSFGAVRQTPLSRWGPSSLSYRRLCVPVGSFGVVLIWPPER